MVCCRNTRQRGARQLRLETRAGTPCAKTTRRALVVSATPVGRTARGRGTWTRCQQWGKQSCVVGGQSVAICGPRWGCVGCVCGRLCGRWRVACGHGVWSMRAVLVFSLALVCNVVRVGLRGSSVFVALAFVAVCEVRCWRRLWCCSRCSRLWCALVLVWFEVAGAGLSFGAGVVGRPCLC